MNKIKGIPVDKASSRIYPIKIDSSDLVSFSFKYLDFNHSKFLVNKQETKYFCKALERLKGISAMKRKEFLNDRSDALRAHLIKWNETTEPGFALKQEQLGGSEPYQFQISVNKHGRVHGFFIDNVFFVVWLDPEHKLYT